MKRTALIRILVASFVIGVIGATIGGLISGGVAELEDVLPHGVVNFLPNYFAFAIPGIISGFLLCFLGSVWFLLMVRNRGVEAIHGFGALFGTAAGALSGFISIIFIDLVVYPGWFTGEEADLGSRLLSCFLFSIPGAIVGIIAARIITSLLLLDGEIVLLRYVNGQPLKPAKSDSAPTEKK
jgi:hypothetical protein